MTRATASAIAPDPEPIALPRWIRQGFSHDDPESVTFSAGAALAMLDPIARSADPVATLWRRRLALSAAAVVSALEGRREGEAQLRDGMALLRPGDDPGPGGRLLAGWRYLGEARALRPADWAARLPGFFDLSPETAAPLLRGIGQRLAGRTAPLRFAAEAGRAALAPGSSHRGLALWIADATLAGMLDWPRPVPLMAAHLPRGAFRLEGEAWRIACAGAWGRGAVAAFDLWRELSRRAGALRAAQLRRPGKDSAAVIAALLSEDAVAAHAGAEASDRAARRFFDRLTTLGLVRELTGRSSFRLYGL